MINPDVVTMLMKQIHHPGNINSKKKEDMNLYEKIVNKMSKHKFAIGDNENSSLDC